MTSPILQEIQVRLDPILQQVLGSEREIFDLGCLDQLS